MLLWSAPMIVSGLVITGSPFDPSVLLSTALSAYVPASRMIVLALPLALAVLIAAIRHAVSPEPQ